MPGVLQSVSATLLALQEQSALVVQQLETLRAQQVGDKAKTKLTAEEKLNDKLEKAVLNRTFVELAAFSRARRELAQT